MTQKSGESVPERETWAQFVQRVTRGLSRAEIATAAGIDPSGVSRWLKSDHSKPRAESVVQFARGIGIRPVEALLAAGYLNMDEVEGAFEVGFSPSAFSNDELLEEMRVRLEQRPPSSGITGTGLGAT